MIRGRWQGVAALAGVTSLILAGCASEKTEVAKTPSVFTSTYNSQAEAVSQMKSTYSRYMVALARVVQSGGKGAERLRPFLTKDQYGREKKSMESFASSGNRVVGAASVAKFTPQRIDLRSGSASVYVCIDVGSSKIEDEDGRDVTPKSRADNQALIVSFARGPLIASSKTWSGQEVC